MGTVMMQELAGLSEAVAGLLKEWKVPGVGVAVVKDGQVVLLEGFGLRDVEKNLPVTPDTLFAIGSASKAFTTAGMAMLVDEGKLDWDKPVHQYLPAFKLWDEFATARMTPRDLVCHRSGLPRHDLMWYNSPFSREEIVSRVEYLEPNKDFRTTWQYQNLMFLIAGFLAGKVGGAGWEDLTQKRIFDPLGMTSSNFSANLSCKTPNCSKPYQEKKGEILEMEYREIQSIGPAGSIYSNVTDMAKWVLLHLKKGKLGDKQLVSEANMQQMHIPQMLISDTSPENIIATFKEIGHGSYGLGWFINTYRGHETVHHGGNIDGFSANVSFMPDDNIGVVVLSNQNSSVVPMILTYWLFDRLLGLTPIDWNPRARELWGKMKAMMEETNKQLAADKVEGTLHSHPLDAYTGQYEHPGYGVVTVVKDGDALKATFNQLDFPMKHYHYDSFEMSFEQMDVVRRVSFFTDSKGNIGSLEVQLEPSVKDIVFTRAADKAMKDKAFLAKFAGEYELMGMTVKVALKGSEALLVTIPGQPELELAPFAGTEFRAKGIPGVSVEFKLDTSGAVTAAVLSQPGGSFTAKRKS